MTPSVRVATALGLVALTALSIAREVTPPKPVPAAAPDTVFSAERAMRHVDEIAARPHAIGTPEHDRVRDYIVGQLTALGLQPKVQATTGISTVYPSAGRVQNILAWIPGTTTNGKAVLLMAHYDGVGAAPAASDDGSGAAALLETARALRARKRPLLHDVFLLFTDGEEAGLLGAAAFVREHPWAKDVGVVLNFDARGTNGRSSMFETGAGNLSTVAVLGRVGDVSAGSVFTAIYRSLPNDTDLSELLALGQPAMNFGFIGGVLRYHTARDDTLHLDRGSLQHQGQQMLALARAFGDGPLPLARTKDAEFFDVPFLGLIVYPQWLALPLAFAALVLVGWLFVKVQAGMVVGFVAALASTVAAAALALLVHLSGPAAWSGLPAAALVAFVLAVDAAAFVLARRRAEEHTVYVGALLVWLLVAIVATLAAPGTGYLFTWPLLFAAVAARSRSVVPQWVVAIVALTMLGGFAYGVAVIALGVGGAGAAGLAVLTSLIAWLLLPLLAGVAGEAKWAGAPWLAGAGAVLVVLTFVLVHPTSDQPISTSLAYAESADSSGAWLGVSGTMSDWAHEVVGAHPSAPPPASPIASAGFRLPGRAVSRVALDAPVVKLLRDTIISAHRRLVMRVIPPRGATALTFRAPDAHVASASLDERVVDTTHYRAHPPGWLMAYAAPPDSGVLLALSLQPGERLTLDVGARRPGLPTIPGLSISARPASVVPFGAGDVSLVYRRVQF